MNFTHQLINGRILPKEEALIPLTDLGMLRAYGIFDFFRVLGGIPVFIEDHLDRMANSTRELSLDLPWSRDEIRGMIHALIAANQAADAGFRIVVTGGFSEDGFTPGTPNLYMMLHPLPVYDLNDWRTGCSLITTPYVRDIPTAKTCIYVNSLLAYPAMKRAGAVEVLYHWKGSITECSRSNVFFVTPEGVLVTPAEGMLHGITRKQVLTLAGQMGIPVELREIHLEEIPWVREAFITSSTRGVLPITRIDQIHIGDGQPGLTTLQLQDAFQALVKRTLAEAIQGV